MRKPFPAHSFFALHLRSVAMAAALVVTGPALAQAPAAPPAGQPAKPVDPAFAAAEKAFLALDVEARRAIQKDLMWTAKFEATASGDFGPLTFAALKRFETEAKLAADGILTPAERAKLQAEADKLRLAARFAIETDKVSGMKIGIPGTIFAKSAPNSSGGTRWQDRDEKITLDLTVYKKEDSLPALFEKGTDAKVQGRKITYKLIRPDFFVISGETASGKFYRRVQADASGAIKGFSIGYDKAVAPTVDRMLIAIAASFEPFAKTGGARPEAKPGSVPVAAAPAQRRATGLVLAPETILTAEAALKSCAEIVVAGGNDAPKIPAKLARRLDGTGLMVLTARAGKPMAARVVASADGPAVLVQRDMDGDLLASAATLAGGRAATSLQEGGAGAALFDKSGALVGIINTVPVSKFRVAGVVPVLTYAFLPASEVFKAAGLQAPAGGESAGKSSAEIAEGARTGVVSLVCASDK
ncbi:MAG: peptidoglycan-binding [Beijerinckiaceae bacterium]|nr:MAG: peptidoglycan-binding [Beijerinckiaceae bacterium]